MVTSATEWVNRFEPNVTYLFVTHPFCWKMASLLTLSTVNKSSVNSAPFNWQAISGIVNGLSIFVKCLCVSFCVGYLLSFSDTALDLLTVSPGKLMPPNFRIWTVLTHCLIEVCIDTHISCGLGWVILKADRKTARPHRLDDCILCGRVVAVGCAYGGPPYVRSSCSIVCGRRP